MECLDDDTVLASIQGTLPRSTLTAVHEHLATCENCRILVAEASKFAFPESAAGPEPARIVPAPAEAPGPALLPRGARVSRYIVEQPLGTGAYGVVYRAYDPQLTRWVALKLLQPGKEPERLLREAQAMAQLSHPHVVNVFDAGVYEDRVFMVMELVLGETMAAWLRGEPHGWREITRVFVEAGRGLAAAHAAGLVHRDFKPENVLIGADHRVRVTDFGLARSADAQPPRVAPTDIGASGARVTAPAGTPVYMSPEQLVGKRADERSDQFGYCVALCLAISGRHPFGGGSAGEGPNLLNLARELEAAELGGRREGQILPPELRGLLARGLRLNPDERHPSMQILVDALEAALRPAPAWRGPRAAAAVAVAGVVAAATGVLIWRAASVPAAECGNGKAEAGEECDDGNRTETDGCLSTCRQARCGDGKVRAGVEECDDGNSVSGDGCSAACLVCGGGDAAFFWDESGHCYTRHDRPLPWAAAREACEALGAHLVVPGSTYESRAIFTALIAGIHPRPRTWLGLSDSPDRRESDPLRRPGPGTFAWITDEAVVKPYWAPGEPRPGGGCVLEIWKEALAAPAGVMAGSAWSTADCALALPYVCERAGWTIHRRDNHAYRQFAAPRSWSDADAFCRAQGGHLATITSIDEHELLAAPARQGFWIGATESESEGVFRWTTGEPFTFHRFAPGEPDHQGRPRDCVFFGADRLWHDRMCAHRHPLVCEID